MSRTKGVFRRLVERSWWVLTGMGLLVWMGGCPIDRDEVFTEALRAALNTAVESLIETVSQQLAGS